MTDLPFLPLWVSTYEAHTAHLSLCEDGAYNRLLRLCWRTPGCSLPADDVWVMRQMRVDQTSFDAFVKPVLSEFFKVRRGRYVNDKLKEVFDEASEKTERRKNAGRKGGEAKARKTKETAPSNATPKLEQCSGNLEPELELHTEKKEANASSRAPRAARHPKVEAVFMADDWWPSQADFEWALQPRNTKGVQLTIEEIQSETDQCKRWFLDKRDAGNPIGKRPGHSRSWQTWICKAAPGIVSDRQRANRSAAGRSNGPQHAPKGSLHDAFAGIAAAATRDPGPDAGRFEDHSDGAGPRRGPPVLEVLDFGDDRGLAARRSGGDRDFAGPTLFTLPTAAVR